MIRSEFGAFAAAFMGIRRDGLIDWIETDRRRLSFSLLLLIVDHLRYRHVGLQADGRGFKS
jgi:hypothetical protein